MASVHNNLILICFDKWYVYTEDGQVVDEHEGGLVHDLCD